jgi:hypothetical protein
MTKITGNMARFRDELHDQRKRQKQSSRERDNGRKPRKAVPEADMPQSELAQLRLAALRDRAQLRRRVLRMIKLHTTLEGEYGELQDEKAEAYHRLERQRLQGWLDALRGWYTEPDGPKDE